MRKCRAKTNHEVIRSDELLLSMWDEFLHDSGLKGLIDPNIDSRERREFYKSNRKYWVNEEVDGLFHEWDVTLRNLIMVLVIIQLLL